MAAPRVTARTVIQLLPRSPRPHGRVPQSWEEHCGPLPSDAENFLEWLETGYHPIGYNTSSRTAAWPKNKDLLFARLLTVDSAAMQSKLEAVERRLPSEPSTIFHGRTDLQTAAWWKGSGTGSIHWQRSTPLTRRAVWRRRSAPSCLWRTTPRFPTWTSKTTSRRMQPSPSDRVRQ